MNNASGGCLCGKVRFTAENVEHDFDTCHCAMCRKWCSSPFFTAMVSGVTFEDDEHLRIYDSSNWAERGFCKSCGSNLFYRLKSGQYFVSVGAFDDPAPFKLVREVYIDHKPGGYAFEGELLQLTEAQVIELFAPSD